MMSSWPGIATRGLQQAPLLIRDILGRCKDHISNFTRQPSNKCAVAWWLRIDCSGEESLLKQ